jgi:lipoprotein-releasing system permease protein
MSFEVLVALRYLRARRKQNFISIISLLSMVGVALGVCALVVVLSVMSGAESELRRKILGMNAHVMVYRAGEVMDHPQKVIAKARQVPGVVQGAAFAYGQIMVVSGSGASGAIMRGINAAGALETLDLQKVMTQGSVRALDRPDPDGLPGILLGGALARRLSVRPGAVVTLLNPLGEDTPVGRVPKSEPFRVKGTFRSGMYQYDSSLCYVSLKAAQAFLDLGDAVSGVEFKVDDIYAAEKIGREVAQALGPMYYARDWMTMNHALFSALKLEKIAMFVILILIVLVAAFGIVSSLIMLVMEKTRDIAILKAMGSTAKSIRRIFVLEGLIIGVLGTVLGLGSGLGLCALLARYKFIDLPVDIYALDTLPVQVEPYMVALVGISAVAISLLATLYPAHAAGRLDPVEALRYQ